MLMITQSDIERLLTPADYIDLIEDAFAAYARGDTLPSRLAHLDSPPGEFHIKASGLGGVVGVKPAIGTNRSLSRAMTSGARPEGWTPVVMRRAAPYRWSAVRSRSG
ncbi:hypothetical protein AB0J28_49660 [Streptosporangium canum]|uniref:hypothetical protein n=1 Tax=Streptosporangium canum TaxID=324952 RepID=UPI003447395B